MTDTTLEAVDWDYIPDTPEQRALIAAHNAEMKRAYPNLIDLDSLSAQLTECEARLLKVTAEREEENIKFQMANTAWDQETATRKVAEAQAATIKALVEALKECEAEIDQYIRQEYPADHPVHERYRQRDFGANPARIALAQLKEHKP
jgi:transposase